MIDAAEGGVLVELQDHVARVMVPERDVLDGAGDFSGSRFCHASRSYTVYL